MSWLIPGWVKLALLAGAAAALAGLYAWRVHAERDVGRAEVRAEWNTQIAVQMRAAMAADAKNRAIEQEAARLAAKAQQRKDDETHAINARLVADLERLRNRPERPAASSGAVPSDPAPAAACTGAELFRPDAEFLVREAARADRILAERDYCHDRYDSLTTRKKGGAP